MKSLLGSLVSGLLTVFILMSSTMVESAGAETLLEKARAGGTVKIGFSNEPPWAFPGDANKPLGFVNSIALGTLKRMGIEKVEPVITDWGGLIPGLTANRYDLITGGMYILAKRCENMDFSNPIGVFGDVFIVPKGNPKNIQTYQDIRNAGAVLVTGIGYNIVDVARKEGIADDKIMQVPGPTEMLAALLAGRADAGATNYFGSKFLADQSKGKMELSDPAKMPDWTMNWVGIGFRKSDKDFLDAYNKAQAEYLGSEEMMKAVAEYGFGKAQLPGDATTEFACKNR